MTVAFFLYNWQFNTTNSELYSYFTLSFIPPWSFISLIILSTCPSESKAVFIYNIFIQKQRGVGNLLLYGREQNSDNGHNKSCVSKHHKNDMHETSKKWQLNNTIVVMWHPNNILCCVRGKYKSCIAPKSSFIMIFYVWPHDRFL
jgi:hypothetical protein